MNAEHDAEAKAAEQAEADRILATLREDLEQQSTSVHLLVDSVGHLARYCDGARLERVQQFAAAIAAAVNDLQSAHVDMKRAAGVLEAERASGKDR